MAVDAVVVGAGPNGLAAAIELARAGRSVLVVERAGEVGGGTPHRRADVARLSPRRLLGGPPAFAVGSPYLRTLPLEQFGLELLEPSIQAAHPLDDGSAAVLRRSLDETADGLGVDAGAYRSLVEPFAGDWDRVAEIVLGPPKPPRHPALAARFALSGRRPVAKAAKRFHSPGGRALLGGMAAHSMLPLTASPTTAFALVLLALGHAAGWPVARGGSQAITEGMRAYLESLGGSVETGREIRSLSDLPASAAVLFDTTPRQLAAICGEELPRRYRAALGRYRYGPGVFKLDYALSGPVPWTAEACRSAGTVHLGGTFEEIAASELAVSRGATSDRPYVLVAQQSLVDPFRAPAGHHTLWAYCHVPNGSTAELTPAIEAQIERFAPGFSELVLARSARGPAELEADNPNYIGGDINGGLANLRQVLARPVMSACPYATPNPRLYLCSSSTPPGGGVHGMCGYHAARAVLRRAR